MGRDVPAVSFRPQDRGRYRDKGRRSLDVLAQMLRESRFEFERPQVGLEIELNLVDSRGEPAMKNAGALDAIADPEWATELGQFNIEINIPPQELSGDGTRLLEESIRRRLNHAQERAARVDGHLMLGGILPTLREGDVNEAALSANPRYKLLNEQIFAARGED